MSELQSDSSNQPSFSSQDILRLGDRLDDVLVEQEAGNIVDQARVKLDDRYQNALDDLAVIQANLEEVQAKKSSTEEEISDIVNRLGSDELVGAEQLSNADDNIVSTLDLILTTNLRKQRALKRTLVDKMTHLKDSEASCRQYIADNRRYEKQLAGRPESIKQILGHIAAALTLLEDLPKVEFVSSLFSDVYKYEPIISDGDIRDFTQLLEDSPEVIISIPISLPPPPPQRLPSIQLPPPPRLRYATRPSGTEKIFINR